MQEWEPGFEEGTDEPPARCWGCGLACEEACACEEECQICGRLFCTNIDHEFEASA